MKFMTSKELRSNPSKLWESGTGEETVITVNGKPKAIVIEAENGNIEEQLKSIRRAKAQSALDKLRTYSVNRGLNKLTEGDILAEVKKARKQKDLV
ncbi:MAG: type II toxin-antitoxin system Phd/YefM family antitoxin [bacterium]